MIEKVDSSKVELSVISTEEPSVNSEIEESEMQNDSVSDSPEIKVNVDSLKEIKVSIGSQPESEESNEKKGQEISSVEENAEKTLDDMKDVCESVNSGT